MRISKNECICTVLELITTLWKVYIFLVVTSKWCKIPTGKCMASDRGQNRYSDFVALETPLRFENRSSSHCLLSSWRRFHEFKSSHPSFHRTVFFGALLVFPRAVLWAYVVVASFLCLGVVRSSIHRLRYILGQVLDVWGHTF